MSTTKIKTYVLIVSTDYPKTHKRAGEKTCFPEKILNEQIPCGLLDRKTIDKFKSSGYDFNALTFNNCEPKIHTIRANFPLWEKRIREVQSGKAILSIRYWSGKPYNSKQVEICQLDKDSGIGFQKLLFVNAQIIKPVVNEQSWYKGLALYDLAKNDGLSEKDFKEWFKNYDLSEHLVIIHFTSFRY